MPISAMAHSSSKRGVGSGKEYGADHGGAHGKAHGAARSDRVERPTDGKLCHHKAGDPPSLHVAERLGAKRQFDLIVRVQ